METLAHCIQCKDRVSGKIGSFIYSNDKPFEAVSPVFVDLVGLYSWMNQNGYRSSPVDLRVFKVKP